MGRDSGATRFAERVIHGIGVDGSREEIGRAVLRKLSAAIGGGYIFQSDHSVPGNVSAANYEYVVDLVRERGRYPLQLGEYDLPDLS